MYEFAQVIEANWDKPGDVIATKLINLRDKGLLNQCGGIINENPSYFNNINEAILSLNDKKLLDERYINIIGETPANAKEFVNSLIILQRNDLLQPMHIDLLAAYPLAASSITESLLILKQNRISTDKIFKSIVENKDRCLDSLLSDLKEFLTSLNETDLLRENQVLEELLEKFIEKFPGNIQRINNFLKEYQRQGTALQVAQFNSLMRAWMTLAENDLLKDYGYQVSNDPTCAESLASGLCTLKKNNLLSDKSNWSDLLLKNPLQANNIANDLVAVIIPLQLHLTQTKANKKVEESLKRLLKIDLTPLKSLKDFIQKFPDKINEIDGLINEFFCQSKDTPETVVQFNSLMQAWMTLAENDLLEKYGKRVSMNPTYAESLATGLCTLKQNNQLSSHELTWDELLLAEDPLQIKNIVEIATLLSNPPLKDALWRHKCYYNQLYYRLEELKTIAEEICKLIFLINYRKKLDKEIFKFFRQSTISNETTLTDILAHGAEKNNRTRQVLIELNWMDSNGNITENAPSIVKECNSPRPAPKMGVS